MKMRRKVVIAALFVLLVVLPTGITYLTSEGSGVFPTMLAGVVGILLFFLVL